MYVRFTSFQSPTQIINHFVPLIKHKGNRAREKTKIIQVNSKFSVTIQGLETQKKMNAILILKISKGYGYNTVLQDNSCEGAARKT